MKKILRNMVSFALATIVSCSTSDEERIYEVSPVIVDLAQVPCAEALIIIFWQPSEDQNPALDVLIYEPTSSLFTEVYS
jgi:hypothetical protein